jgi:SP family sugar:H+ symporter-like MFS transporter
MKLNVWLVTIFAAFGGFMFGYDTGVINGVKDTAGFRETFLNESKHSGNGSREESVRESTLLGLVVSTFSIGCLVGALLAAGLSEVLGRKRAIIVGGVVFTGGGAVQAGSLFIWMMILGRIVAGVGVG